MKKDVLRLAIAPRPRGYDWLVDDIRLLKRAGVDLLVSALTHAEADEEFEIVCYSLYSSSAFS